MYFTSRKEAGFRMIEELRKYRFEDSIVIALNEGGVLVGEPIAMQLHCVLTMLTSEDIILPGEPEKFGSILFDGELSENKNYTDSERNYWYSEFRNVIEEQKREGFQKLNRLVGDPDILNVEMVKNRAIILVTDGLVGTTLLDGAADFLRRVMYKKLIIATPLSNVEATDRMHIMADETVTLNIYDDLLDIEHYYDEKDIPSREKIIEKLQNIILHWA